MSSTGKTLEQLNDFSKRLSIYKAEKDIQTSNKYIQKQKHQQNIQLQ